MESKKISQAVVLATLVGSGLLAGCGGTDTVVVREPQQPAQTTVVTPGHGTTVVQPAPATASPPVVIDEDGEVKKIEVDD